MDSEVPVGKNECPCGLSHDNTNDTIVLTLEDNSVVECEIIGIFEVLDSEYIALLPLEEETVLIYEYIETGDEVELRLIKSDGDFEKISKEFYEIFGKGYTGN